MSKKAFTYIIPAFVSLVFIVSVVFLYSSILEGTNGHFIYPLDDTYIHLSIAKHWAESGVPGINSGEFAYLTSSPLWTLILSSITLTGINIETVPFWINFIIGLVLIFYVSEILSVNVSNRIVHLLMLFLIVSALSLPLLVFMGMEHLLHTFLFVIFLIESPRFIRENNKGFYLLVFLLPLVRFESLFAVLVLGLWLAYKKQYGRAVILLLLGALPVALSGFYSIAHGGTFLPSSLLLKGEFFGNYGIYDYAKSLLWHPLKKLAGSIPLAVLLFIAISLLFRSKRDNVSDKYKLPLLFFTFITLLHLLFAQTGWLFRYESYLILSGMVIIVLYFAELMNIHRIAVNKSMFTFLFLLTIPFIMRAYDTNTAIKTASVNIYEQQWQMSEFFNRYYEGGKVAVNDIGVVSYRGNVYVLDLWGLANRNISSLRVAKRLNGEILDSIMTAKNVKIAAVYKKWFNYKNGFYSDWLEVGSWKIRNNLVCGEPELSFFAKDSTDFVKLVKNLIDFSSLLPESVIRKNNRKK